MIMISKNVIGICEGGGGRIAAGGGLFADGLFAAGLIAGGLFASGLNAAPLRNVYLVLMYLSDILDIYINYMYIMHNFNQLLPVAGDSGR